MVEFWTRLHQPDAILMLFVAVLCLAVHQGLGPRLFVPI
jgi:hypothetical protein